MTPKQELFAQAYLETSNASEAYKRAYNTQANANTINRKASQLLKHPEVSTHITVLQNEQRKKHKLTIDDLLQELEQSRLLALENIQCSAAVTATMSKAKLLGLDKQVIEHKADSCVSIKVDFTDAELCAIIAATP
jgi:phage terminase small subunit